MTPEELARLNAEELEAQLSDQWHTKFNALDEEKRLQLSYAISFVDLGRQTHSRPISRELSEAINTLVELHRVEAQVRFLQFLITEILPECATRNDVVTQLTIGYNVNAAQCNRLKDKIAELFKAVLPEDQPPSPKHEPEVTRNEPK